MGLAINIILSQFHSLVKQTNDSNRYAEGKVKKIYEKKVKVTLIPAEMNVQ